MADLAEKIRQAASIIQGHPTTGMAFTGAGISVESGIPPFRGTNGLWNTVDPTFIELNYFYAHPEASWEKIRELFYDHWGKAEPNDAHLWIAKLWELGYLQGVVTQNIDCLHQRAGIPADKISEFHGTLDALVCTQCAAGYSPDRSLIDQQRPTCPKCGGLLKPDFVFFSEGIPEKAFADSFALAEKSDWVLVVGTTGEVMPAGEIPRTVKRHGGLVIEINPSPSSYTDTITDVYLPCNACGAMNALARELKLS